jgi:hypothetical protein
MDLSRLDPDWIYYMSLEFHVLKILLLQQKYWEVMELLRVMHYLEDVRPFVLGS